MAGWKKVIVSGSHAELAQVSASGLKIPQITISTTTQKVLVDGGSGVIHSRAQNLIQGSNTQYSAGTGFALDASSSPQVFTLDLNSDANGIDHDLIPHTASGAHINWLGPNGILHASNYQDTLYTGSDGGSGLHITQSQGGEWTTLPSQAWTQVGALGTDDSGGSINWSGNITNTGSIMAVGNTLQATDLYVTESITSGNPNFQILAQEMSASLATMGSAAVPATVFAGTGIGGLFVSGTFIYNDLTFQEQVLQQYTGSHIFGGSANDTIQDFTGNIYISQGATSSIGFYGTGSGLTNIPSNAVNYQALTFSDGVTGSFATQNFGFDTATTLNAQISSSGGLSVSSDGFHISTDGVTTARISSSAVVSNRILNENIVSGSLKPDIINAHTLSPYAGALSFNPGLDFLLASTGSGASATLGRTKISALRNFLVNSFPDNIDNAGSVITISVAPDSNGTAISNLFLTVTSDVTTTPELGLGSTGGNGLKITNANFITGSGGDVLAINNGGTGASTAQQAAQNILAWEVDDTYALTIGDTSDTITISGSLQVTQGATTNINLENFEVEDKIMHIGLGANASTDDIGIKFGSSLTQSNALFYNGINDAEGRLAYGYDLNPDNTIALSTNHFPMTVFEGNTGNAELVKADQAGMMRVESNEIYLYI